MSRNVDALGGQYPWSANRDGEPWKSEDVDEGYPKKDLAQQLKNNGKKKKKMMHMMDFVIHIGCLSLAGNQNGSSKF
ncbi:hypothetical protein RRF57_006692 [Xylaria bambusicola]|uniref:Uncharacterized protein n=1 Tax=Xylaria bambusicola TaxID=326684 RepID=A0AAN7Z5R7_9PEZI